jgi:hypothetical protein
LLVIPHKIVTKKFELNKNDDNGVNSLIYICLILCICSTIFNIFTIYKRHDLQNFLYLTVNILNLSFFSYLASSINAYDINDIISNKIEESIFLGLELSNTEDKQIIILGLSLLISFFRLLDWYISNKITIYIQSLKKALQIFVIIVLNISIFIILLTFFSQVTLGNFNSNFETFPKALIKVVFMFIGSFDFENLSETHAIYCIILLIIILLIDLFIVSNVFFILFSFFTKRSLIANNTKLSKIKPLNKKSIINWIIFPLNYLILEEEENKTN